MMRNFALDRVERDFIEPSCEERSVTILTADQCGLRVYNKVWGKKRLARFFKRVCKMTDEDLATARPDERCQERLWRKWFALLAERYYMMDVDAVQTRCDGHPEQCEDPETFERWCLKAHNKAVLDRFASEKEAFDLVASAERTEARKELERKLAEEERARHEEMRAIRDALAAIGAGLQGKPAFRCSANGSTCWQE
jgi:hypothetical protein